MKLIIAVVRPEKINDVLEASYEDGSYEAAWDATAGTVLPFIEPPAVDRY